MVERSLLRKGGKGMKRVIVINTEEIDGKEYFVFSEEGNVLFKVDHSTKKVSGKELFTKIYETYTKENPFEVECNIDSLNDEDKKTFGNYLVTLFSKIDAKMKEQFTDTTE